MVDADPISDLRRAIVSFYRDAKKHLQAFAGRLGFSLVVFPHSSL